MSARQQQPTEVDERIARFLGRHHVLTLATAADGTPYCANAFYAYDKGRNRLVFTSDLSTRDWKSGSAGMPRPISYAGFPPKHPPPPHPTRGGGRRGDGGGGGVV